MLFVKCTRNGGDSYSSYEGLNQDTITTLLLNLGCTNISFLSQEDWNSQQEI